MLIFLVELKVETCNYHQRFSLQKHTFSFYIRGCETSRTRSKRVFSTLVTCKGSKQIRNVGRDSERAPDKLGTLTFEQEGGALTTSV